MFTLIPVILSLYYSFCDYSLLQRPAFIGGDNYPELMADPVFWTSLANTFGYAPLPLPAGLLGSLRMALLLSPGGAGLAGRPWVLVGGKRATTSDGEAALGGLRRVAREIGVTAVAVSAVTGEGLTELLRALAGVTAAEEVGI